MNLSKFTNSKIESKISIITVVKNNKNYIEKNIISLLDQKYKNYEHIIIDGNSTDGTLDIINKYKKHFSHFISENDDGIYDAMNKELMLPLETLLVS